MKAGNEGFVPASNYSAACIANGLFMMKLHLHVVHLDAKVYKYFSGADKLSSKTSSNVNTVRAHMLVHNQLF